METKLKLQFLSVIFVFEIILVSTTSVNYEDYSRDNDVNDNKLSLDTAKALLRLKAARTYADDDNESKRNGYRYYGTGSRSGNSFAPTSVHKSTSSLDSHNYFVTTKGINKVKDLETAGTSSDGNSENNYLTVYENPSQAGTAAGTNYMNMMEEVMGEMTSETGHGGGHGHGHGGGGGKGCNSALGLLGVLGLAAYLQNVLRNMPAGMTGRKKRDVAYGDDDVLHPDFSLRDMTKYNLFLLPLNETSEDMHLDSSTYNKIMKDVFPLLGAVAHARDGLIPIHCTHSSVCLANQVLVQHLGYLGHSVGIRISAAIAKLLAKITKDERAEQIRMIVKAGKMGRNGRKCLKVFPTCNRLKRLPTYNIPLESQGY